MTEKLAVNKIIYGLEPEVVKICRAGVLKFGKISITYLMRKLKCSASEGKLIYDRYMNATE